MLDPNGLSDNSVKRCQGGYGAFTAPFRLDGLHCLDTPLAHQSTHEIVKLAIARLGLADAGSAFRSSTGGDHPLGDVFMALHPPIAPDISR